MSSRFLNPGAIVRHLANLERNVGIFTTVFGVLCFIKWWTGRAGDPRHGMFWVFIGGTFLLPFGLLLVLAGYTLASRPRTLWPFQLLVIGWPWLRYPWLFKSFPWF